VEEGCGVKLRTVKYVVSGEKSNGNEYMVIHNVIIKI
jgi:hypothetical protein